MGEGMQSGKKSFLEQLYQKVLLGDGAIGTYIYEKGIDIKQNTDFLNLTEPHLIFTIHEEYVRAGSDVIETNTFGANRIKLGKVGLDEHTREINLAAAAIAKKAAGHEVYVAGSVGPTGEILKEENRENILPLMEEAFREQIQALIDGKVDLIMLDTFTQLEEVLLAIRISKEIASDIPVVAHMVFPSRGRTANGISAKEFGLKAIEAGADVIGSNCGRGVSAMLVAIKDMSSLKEEVPFSAYPNAGLPEIIGGRTVYSAQPAYMAQALSQMIKLGAKLVGGCCGTTPAHIHEFRQILHIKKAKVVIPVPDIGHVEEEKGEETAPSKGGMLEDLKKQELIPILVELDPPPHLDISNVMAGAKELKASGVDAITLAEHPLAILRADNLSIAHKIKTQLGLHTVIHLTCRDRNILGLQAQIMAAHFLGIEAILAITGDPASSSDQPGVSGVFDTDSFGLVKMISMYNQGYNLAGRSMKKRTNISIGVAYSYIASRPRMQLSRLEKKAALGAHFVMTQPIFDPDEVESMYELTKELGLLIFPGIFPLISARNAEFLHNEVPGINVPEWIRKKLWQYEKVEDQRAVALDITKELINKIATWIDGLYIISPLNKWQISKELVDMVRDAKFKGSGRR